MEQYKLPENVDGYIDTEKGELIQQEELTPLQQIEMIGEKLGYKLKKPNSSCTKPGCYGRGYIGWDVKTHAPIPCSCIFEKSENANKNKFYMNRAERRRLEKLAHKRMKKINPAQIEKIKEEVKNEQTVEQLPVGGEVQA